MKRLIILFSMVLFIGAGFSWAQSNSGSQDVAALKDEIIRLQNSGELSIKSIKACSKINGYGSYVELDPPKVKSGDRLLVYLEPANYYINKNNSKYEIYLIEDMLVLNDKGDILWGKEGAVKYNYSSDNPVLDLFIANAIDIKGLVPGRYIFKAEVSDKLKSQKASAILSFEVVE